MKDFVHLHVHSEFSLLDGSIKLDKLIDKILLEGMDSVALTDHGAMYGSFKFFLKATAKKVKPIIGCEVYQAEKSRFDKQKQMGSDQFHLVLLAKNLEGYKNLMKLVSIAHLEGYHYRPRVDFESLKKYSNGLIALSACLQGLVPNSFLNKEPEKAERSLKQYIEIFGEKNFYLELQRHPNCQELDEVNEQLIKLSRKFAIPLVATNDSHYLNKDDAYAQEILLCIQTRTSILEKNRPLSMIKIPDFYIKSIAEMKALFIDYPEAIDNTVKISEQCNVEIPNGKLIFPEYPIPKGKTAESYLQETVMSRVSERFLTTTPEIDKRIDYELKIISQKGFAPYFLIVQDFVNWAKKNKIAVGPGRGSAAGSIVAYILKITELDPLLHKLPFERFLNPERPTPPDIDTDFADIRRDEVVRYVMQKYGEDRVAQIITFGSMEARMVIRDVSRALGWSYSQGDRLAKLIPQGKQGFPMSIDLALQESTELNYLYRSDEKIKDMIEISKKLEGLVRHASVHAAGLVVGDKPLTEYTPLQRENRGGKIITQYDMYCLDLNAVSDGRAVGILKFDFLGLRNLTILEKALAFIKENQQIEFELNKLPLDDKETFSLISRGETVGVFQLESRGMRHLAKELQPTQFSDISAMVALFRPGPMSLIPQFIEGKKNAKTIHYLTRDLEPILAETYGILVYQEQVTEIAHRLAGFSMSEGDLLRMAMGKKKKELMKKGEVKFIEGCIRNGYSKKIAEQIFEFIEKFAAYGFNKSHSASYATISYWTAYVKAHFPIEFMTALITAEIASATGADREQKVVQVLEECRRMELPVLRPDINTSKAEFSIEKNKTVRFGLAAVKNVGDAAIEAILEARNKELFSSFKDFLIRVDLRRVNKKTIECLVKSGAFDEFGKRAQLLVYYGQIVKNIQSDKTQSDSGQFALFGGSDNVKKNYKDELPEISEFDSELYLEYEREAIGFNLSVNPLERYQKILFQKKTLPLEDLAPSKKEVLIGGIVKAVKKILTKKDNSEMAFATITDYTGEVELVVFPRVYAKNKELWQRNQPLLVKGIVQDKDNSLVIIVNDAASLKLYD